MNTTATTTIAFVIAAVAAFQSSDAKIIESDQHRVYPAFQGEAGYVVIDADLHDMPIKLTQDIRESMVWYGDHREAAQEAAAILNARFSKAAFAVQELVSTAR